MLTVLLKMPKILKAVNRWKVIGMYVFYTEKNYSDQFVAFRWKNKVLSLVLWFGADIYLQVKFNLFNLNVKHLNK